MNALAVSAKASAVHAEPGFEAVLSLVADAYGIPKGELRARTDEESEGAKACFLWLCDQLKTRGVEASAAFIGMATADVLPAVANVERQRTVDPSVRAHTDELALTLHCEAITLDRLKLHRSADPDTDDIARRILSSRRAAGLVGLEDLQSLAADYARLRLTDDHELLRAEVAALTEEVAMLRAELLAPQEELVRVAQTSPHPLEAPLREFIVSAAEVDRASGPYERTARARQEKASLALRAAGETHFNIQRKFK